MKLTEWYPADVKPVRDGVYESVSPYLDQPGWYSRWENGEWHIAYRYVRNAAKDPYVSVCQDREWRGLAEEPK